MGGVRPFTVESRPRPESGKATDAQYRMVGPGYFHTMKISLVKGREFTKQDEAQAAGVVVINQAFKRRYFPDEDPIGNASRSAATTTSWARSLESWAMCVTGGRGPKPSRRCTGFIRKPGWRAARR